MDVISNLGLGFAVALTIQNIAYCFIGVLLGTIIGVLPGIGPVTTVAMLLPISFTLQPESALILLAGIYYGAQYGGSTTAILVNIPGEASSVVTTIDGHQMARQGRAGPALGIAAIGSFFAGCVSTMLIACAAPPLARIALHFRPARSLSPAVGGLYAGEERGPTAAPFRRRRHPRRRGAGIRQQRGGADLVRPDAHPGHPRQSDHGHDDRGADDPRHRARPARDDRSSGTVLGT